MNRFFVVMGVAGCGKSSLAARWAEQAGLPLIEGDDHHSPASRDKMQRGIALTDADRAGWLDRLGAALQSHPTGAVLSCSALKRAYRERLRAAVPDLRFIFLAIDRDTALQRVASRSAHFFSATLIDDQFATLEPPTGEAGVLALDATLPIDDLCRRVAATWSLLPV
jgi:gluconokinase